MKVTIKQNGVTQRYDGLTFKLTCAAVEQYLGQIMVELERDHGNEWAWIIQPLPHGGYKITKESKTAPLLYCDGYYGNTPRKAMMACPELVQTMKRIGHIKEERDEKINAD